MFCSNADRVIEITTQTYAEYELKRTWPSRFLTKEWPFFTFRDPKKRRCSDWGTPIRAAKPPDRSPTVALLQGPTSTHTQPAKPVLTRTLPREKPIDRHKLTKRKRKASFIIMMNTTTSIAVTFCLSTRITIFRFETFTNGIVTEKCRDAHLKHVSRSGKINPLVYR